MEQVLMGAFGGPTNHQIADAVLDSLVQVRIDNTHVAEVLAEEYYATFSHETMVPETQDQKCIREFLEKVFYRCKLHHLETHKDCAERKPDSFEVYCEGWRRQGFEYARNTWLESMNVEVPDDAYDLNDYSDSDNVENGDD